MIDIFSALIMFIVGVIWIRHDDKKSYKKADEYFRAWPKPYDDRRQDKLFMEYKFKRVEADGKPIPKDKWDSEIMYLVIQQLKREGLNPSPFSIKKINCSEFNEEGYHYKHVEEMKKWPKPYSAIRQNELLNEYRFTRKECDGTPIPPDKTWDAELMLLVYKQLKKEGLNPSPAAILNVDPANFDKDGYHIRHTDR